MLDEHTRPPLPMVSAILPNSSHRFAEALCGAAGRCPALSTAPGPVRGGPPTTTTYYVCNWK